MAVPEIFFNVCLMSCKIKPKCLAKFSFNVPSVKYCVRLRCCCAWLENLGGFGLRVQSRACVSVENLIKIPLNKKALRKKRTSMFTKSRVPLEADAHYWAMLNMSFGVPHKGAPPLKATLSIATLLGNLKGVCLPEFFFLNRKEKVYLGSFFGPRGH